MNKATQNLWAFIGILPVVLISFVIIRMEIREERCYGLVDAFVFVILNGALIISLIISGIIQLMKLSKGKENKVRILNLIMMGLFSGIAFWLSSVDDVFFREPVILEAELIESLDLGKIVLRENKNFSAQYGHIDWSCVKVGKYEIKNDTLFLGDRISKESNNIIAAKYLIRNNEYLLPIDSNFIIQDTTQWMKIDEIKKENWR